MPTGISGPGEMGRKESYAPPSARGTEGYVKGICGGQEAVMESGLKGGAEAIPGSTAGTEPAETLPKSKGMEQGGFHGSRP